MELFDRIQDASRRWDVLRHPFYTRWSCGELTPAELAWYAGEYRHLVVALASTAERVGGDRHAAEERAHVNVWDAFAAALDADIDRPAAPETEACAAAWSPDDPLEALAVLYAVESAQPAISRTKLAGLLDHYGFEEGSATDYFSIHAMLDAEHAGESRAALERRADKGDADRLAAVAEAALHGNWVMLDGVERAVAS